MDFLAALSQIGRAAIRGAAQASTPSTTVKRKSGVECTPCAANAFLAKIHGHDQKPRKQPRKKAR